MANIQGSWNQVIAQLAELPNGRALSEALKLVKVDFESAKLRVSSDLRRATLEITNGKLVSVRVTTGRPSGAGGGLRFRFKPPRDLTDFEGLYFGGLNQQGNAVIKRFTPQGIGLRRTLTITTPCE
jgi:hypothetical protein